VASFVETFAAAPAASFAALSSLSGTAVHEPATESMAIDVPNGVQQIWRILQAGLATEFTFEMDVELLVDYFNQKHFGIWLVDNTSGRNMQEPGFRISSYVPYNIDVRDWSSSANAERPSISAPSVPTTGVVTWKIGAKKIGTSWLYRLQVGGITFFDKVHVSVYGEHVQLMPAIFVYGCKIRVHEVRWSDLTTFPSIANRSENFLAFRRPLHSLELLTGAPRNVSQRAGSGRRNIYQGGSGTIQGTVTIENIPGARQVRLFDKRSGLLIAETWSTPTGHYKFNNVDADREYFVVAHDHLRVYNAVVQDMLTP
jgi:hypothetical protein